MLIIYRISALCYNFSMKIKPLIIILCVLVVIAVVMMALALNIITGGRETVAAPSLSATIAPTPSPEPTAHPVGEPVKTDGGIDAGFFQPCEFPGTVETVSYMTGGTEKQMRVYLPYGYDSSRQYDVLVLLHGFGGRETYWFDEDRWYNDPDTGAAYPSHANVILDNMIANGFCKPVIAVSPTYYLNDEWRAAGDILSRDTTQFRSELRNDILPAVAENYSTYPVGDRDHYAFIGASHGAVICYNAVMTYDLDLFSWFGAVSGCETSVGWMEECWRNYGLTDYDIKYFYISAGENDFLREQSYSGYYDMSRFCTKITDDNIEYVVIRNAIHEDIVWMDAIYNCMLEFFS